MKSIIKAFSLVLAASAFALACAPKAPIGSASPTPPTAYDDMSEYNEWADSYGYEHGELTSEGSSGLYMDRFMTLSSDAAYYSGRIVIGDSRCCQLGIYQMRAESAGFAAFAVWGGHFRNGSYPPIMTDTLVSEIENCFKKQIEAHGSSTVFFFATVNDYDYASGDNGGNIAAAICAAERIASMEYEYNGRIHRPKVIIIGFDGSIKEGSLWGGLSAEVFNRYVSDYNAALKAAVEASALLKENSDRFTTVPEIVGETGFITDLLHYDDITLGKLCEFIINAAE